MKGLVLVAVLSVLILSECQFSPEWDAIQEQNSFIGDKTRYKKVYSDSMMFVMGDLNMN